MQISSNSSSHSSTNELNSDNRLNNLISSSTTEGKKESYKVSFSVLRQKSTKFVSQNKLLSKRDYDENEDDDQSRKRGILHLEDGVPVESDIPRKKDKVFIIPVLRLSNQAQINRLKKLAEEGNASEQDLARLALLIESVGDNSDEIQTQTLEGNHSLLPTASDSLPTVVLPDDIDPDYECMPVGEFGLAFLRGCGWKNERSAIGRTNAKAVPLPISKPRPKGLGLGATVPSIAPEINDSTRINDQSAKNGENFTKTLCKNAFVMCSAGMHKNVYGQVTSLDVENSSVFIEITWPLDRIGKTIRVSQFSVELVSPNDFKQKLDDLNEIKTENGVKKARNRDNYK